jgi:hypothetical protein
MIRFRSSGGQEHEIMPVFVCDICGNAITDIRSGAVVFRNRGVGEDELLELLHVHKGNCHDQAEARLTPGASGPWHELEDHLGELAAGMGVTIRKLINKTVSWTCCLDPNQYNALQDRITELGNWLREHGISSPLWD